jgi:hypothetical protein
MIDKERDNSALIALLMVYKSYDHSIEVPDNIRLKDTIIFEVNAKIYSLLLLINK